MKKVLKYGTDPHFLLCLLSFCTVVAEADMLKGPWSVSSEAPVVQAVDRPPPSVVETTDSLGSSFCLFSLFFYQDILSVVVHSTCPMEPSCSNYSKAAVQKHGWLMGSLLTVDRFLRERDEVHHSPLIYTAKQEYKFLDPVEYNDFWW